jgi:hypothetical protein
MLAADEYSPDKMKRKSSDPWVKVKKEDDTKRR